MTVELNGGEPVKETRTIEGNVKNVMQLSEAELIGDIEYVIFAEHEFPMEHYTAMQPVIKSLAELIVTHADEASRRAMRDLTYKIASHLKDEVTKVVYDAMPVTKTQVPVIIEKESVSVEDISSLMGGE